MAFVQLTVVYLVVFQGFNALSLISIYPEGVFFQNSMIFTIKA